MLIAELFPWIIIPIPLNQLRAKARLFEGWINRYPVDNCYQNKPCYPLDSDLLGGEEIHLSNNQGQLFIHYSNKFGAGRFLSEPSVRERN